MLTENQQNVISEAIEIIESQYKHRDLRFTSPELVRTYCQVQIGGLEHEVFAVLFLDTQNQLLKFEKMFRGTVHKSAVHLREIVKESLLVKRVGIDICTQSSIGCCGAIARRHRINRIICKCT